MKENLKEREVERRKLLGVATKGSSLIAAKTWIAPAVVSLALPVHAQSSTTGAPGNCAPDMSTSDSRERTVVQPDINRNWTFDQYDPQDGTLSMARLDYDYTVGTDFVVINDDSLNFEFTVETIATFIMTTPKAGQNNRDDLRDLPQIFLADRVTTSQTVTVAIGERESITGLEVNVSGSIDLLAAGIDPSVFVGSGQLQINYDAEDFSTRVRARDNLPFRIRSPSYFIGNATINYSCTL